MRQKPGHRRFRKRRKGELTCSCPAYAFPHRMMGGKCSGIAFVEDFSIAMPLVIASRAGFVLPIVVMSVRWLMARRAQRSVQSLWTILTDTRFLFQYA